MYEFHAYNFTNKTQAKKSKKIINFTYTGVIADVLARRTYIAVNEIYLIYYGTEDIVFTTPIIYRQEIIVLVLNQPKSKHG